MEAVKYETYADYCAPRRELGLGVIPESLFNGLKEQEMQFEDMDTDMLCMEHFDDLREELGYQSVWSMYDAGVQGLDFKMFKSAIRVRYQFVREDATTAELVADMEDGGQRSMAEVTSIAVTGDIGGLWRAAESCIKQSGTHHRYIEAFEMQDDGTLMLITGS